MRCCAFLWATADLGVRFSYRAISFCRVSCIFLLRSGKPSCGYLWQVCSLRSVLGPPAFKGSRYGTSRARKNFAGSEANYAFILRLCPSSGTHPRAARATSRKDDPVCPGPALEQELQRELHRAWITNFLGQAEGRPVRDVPIHAVELRVIPDVVQLGAKLHLEPLFQLESLEEAHVPIGNPWLAADRPRRIAERAGRHRQVGELVGIKRQSLVRLGIPLRQTSRW